MKIYPIIISFLFGLTVFANEDNSFTKGIKAHSEHLYEDASTFFLQAIEEDPSNISAYYNFGLSSIGTESYGKAVWGFEKVLKYKPNDIQAQEKIEYCYERINSATEYSPMLNGFTSILYSFSSNTWSILAILFSIVAAGAIVLWKLNKIKTFSKLLLGVGLSSTIICIATILLAKSTYEFISEEKNAVVINKSASSYYDPQSVSEITLLEGMRLSVISIKNDTLIEVMDSEQKTHLVLSSEVWLF